MRIVCAMPQMRCINNGIFQFLNVSGGTAMYGDSVAKSNASLATLNGSIIIILKEEMKNKIYIFPK